MVVDLPFTLHPTFSFRNLVCQTKCKMKDATAGTCRKKNNRHVLRTHGTSSTTPISPHLRLPRSLPASQPHSLTAPSLLRYLPASQTPLSHRCKFPPLFASQLPSLTAPSLLRYMPAYPTDLTHPASRPLHRACPLTRPAFSPLQTTTSVNYPTTPPRCRAEDPITASVYDMIVSHIYTLFNETAPLGA